jgi:hypothetical protein
VNFDLSKPRYRRADIVAAAALVGCVLASPSHAVPVNPEALAVCLFENSTSVEKGTLKKLMIAALTDDIGSLTSLSILLASSVVNLAMEKCEVTVEQIAESDMNSVLELYGSQVGQQIMEEAFAKIR